MPDLSSASNRPGLPQLLVVLGFSLAYLLLSAFFLGFKSDQVVLVALFNTCYFASGPSRRFALAYLIFIAFWVIFDSMKAYPNYLVNDIHIADLYAFEKKWFGTVENGVRLTPNEYLLLHTSPALDFASGLFYLTWVPVPMGFGFYLFLYNKPLFLRFALTFLFVNLLGFVIYYLYPAAPPWYVQVHGFVADVHTPGNRAGMERFDALIGFDLFKSMYAKSSNVFAAMPSLHSSYPVIVLFYGLRSKLIRINVLFGILMGGIWWAAVYSSHHYVIDVLAGIVCAVTGIWLFHLLAEKVTFVRKLLQKYEEAI